MPSLDYHVSRSRSEKNVAEELHRLMDMPKNVPFSVDVHHKWRGKTHNLRAAFAIGMIVGQEGNTPRKCILDALTHINDDLSMSLFKNALRAQKSEEREEE